MVERPVVERPVDGRPAVGRLVVERRVAVWVMALVEDTLQEGAMHPKALAVRLVHILSEQVDEVEEPEDQILAPECCY